MKLTKDYLKRLIKEELGFNQPEDEPIIPKSKKSASYYESRIWNIINDEIYENFRVGDYDSEGKKEWAAMLHKIVDEIFEN